MTHNTPQDAACEACGTTESQRAWVSTVAHGDRWICQECAAETLSVYGDEPEPAKRPRGRPAKYGQPMTPAQRKAAERARRKAQGYRQKTHHVTGNYDVGYRYGYERHNLQRALVDWLACAPTDPDERHSYLLGWIDGECDRYRDEHSEADHG